jgi:ferrous iron transport protein B
MCQCHALPTPSVTPSDTLSDRSRYVVALAGNPNAGKTTLFNALTGARQHVGNWPGKTVEKKTGRLRAGGLDLEIVDLPGTYSLSAFSPEEVIARDYILQAHPDLVVNVVDAGNLERNLYLTVQLLELGAPLLLVLNQMDMAHAAGIVIDQAELAALLGGVPVLTTVGSREQGVAELIATVVRLVQSDPAGPIPACCSAAARTRELSGGLPWQPA